MYLRLGMRCTSNLLESSGAFLKDEIKSNYCFLERGGGEKQRAVFEVKAESCDKRALWEWCAVWVEGAERALEAPRELSGAVRV